MESFTKDFRCSLPIATSLPNRKFARIAEREGVGPAQVVFRFAMQVGMLPLTGTTNRQHMLEDLAAERITLSADEVQRIETIGL